MKKKHEGINLKHKNLNFVLSLQVTTISLINIDFIILESYRRLTYYIRL